LLNVRLAVIDPNFILLVIFANEAIIQKVDTIIINGNKQTKDRIIKREILHSMHTPVDSLVMLEDINRLYNLGIFSTVDINIENNAYNINVVESFAMLPDLVIDYNENLKKWFNFKFEIIYFYNVYGPRQISKGQMATVIGIFEENFLKGKPLPVVRPGNQSRRFTHIFDTVKACYLAWKRNKCLHYSISNRQSYSIIEVAKMFEVKIKFLKSRPGERYASALTRMNLSNKVHRLYGDIKLKNYIENFLKIRKKSK